MTVLTDELLASFDASVADVAKAVTMPPEIYTSEEFLAFERDALFATEWHCVGRASRVANVGDYFTTTVNGEPIIVARAKDGSVGAFSAVCQHRGMQVVDDAGNCTKFTCPYHQWSYDLTGRLLGAPAMERTEAFDKKDHPLPALSVELWQGFVFVNFVVDARPLAPTLATYEPYLANYDLENAVCPGTFTLPDLPWNWKVMFENFNDGYHANKLHHTIQDFCPSELAAFPVEWTPDSNVIFRTNGYTHIDGGFNATTKALLPVFPQLTEEERWRSTFALDAADAVLRHRPRSGVLLHRPSQVGRHHRSRDRLPAPPERARAPDVRAPLPDERRRRAGVRASGPGRDHQGPARHAQPLSPRVVATRGRRRATCSSTAGWSTAIAVIGRRPPPADHQDPNPERNRFSGGAP